MDTNSDCVDSMRYAIQNEVNEVVVHRTTPIIQAVDTVRIQLQEMREEIYGKLYEEITRINNRLYDIELRLTQLETNTANDAQLQALREQGEWLRNRCADIERIFNWEDMILNGVKK